MSLRLQTLAPKLSRILPVYSRAVLLTFALFCTSVRLLRAAIVSSVSLVRAASAVKNNKKQPA